MLPKFSDNEKELILTLYQDKVPLKQLEHVFRCAYSYPSTLARRVGVSREQRFRVKRDWLLVFSPGTL